MYWQTLISESSGNARKLWNTLSSVMGKKKGSIVQENFTPELFLNSIMDKVSGVRSSTVGSPAPEFSNFVGSPLNQFSTIDQSVIEDSIRKVIKQILQSRSHTAYQLGWSRNWCVN